MFIICFVGAASTTAGDAMQGTDAQILSGDRVLLGTPEGTRSDQARIHTGEGNLILFP
jgi:hypothetical protein